MHLPVGFSVPQSSSPAPPTTAADNDQFEELINLGSMDQKNRNPLSDSSQLDADLINSNNSVDNQPPLGSPLIAFEESSTTKTTATTSSTGETSHW